MQQRGGRGNLVIHGSTDDGAVLLIGTTVTSWLLRRLGETTTTGRTFAISGD
jgi:hypothetical protein